MLEKGIYVTQLEVTPQALIDAAPHFGNAAIFESIGGNPYPLTSTQPGPTSPGIPGGPYPVPFPGPGGEPALS